MFSVSLCSTWVRGLNSVPHACMTNTLPSCLYTTPEYWGMNDPVINKERCRRGKKKSQVEWPSQCFRTQKTGKLCIFSALNQFSISFLYSDLARLESCDYPNPYEPKAEGKAVVIKSLFLLWSCSLYLFHGIRWTKNPTAAATGACWGICRAPRGGPTARGLHCENLLIRKSQLVEELLIFIHCQLQKEVS